MNPAQLLNHFDRIAEAPEAVPRLRRFVLDLAVRGKLVEQDPGDESPVEHLKQARQRLEETAETTKRVRWKSSNEITIADVEKPIPRGWLPVRVNDTGFYINGLAFKPSDWKQEGLPIIRIQNLTDPAREFNFVEGDFPEEVLVRDGDILVSWSATLEAFKWERGLAVLNQHIFRVIPAQGLTMRDFLLLLLRHAIREMADSEHAHGLVMSHINRGPFLDHIVLIPPLAEQHRIVAKVDELMALCDRLEATQSKREQRRDRLAAASLNRINQPAPSAEGGSATPFREHVRFHLDHLPRLTTRTEHIKSLRQAILDLAVRGRLVSQAADDEPPRSSLRGIRAERDELVRAKLIRSDKPLAPVGVNEPPFGIPATWLWARIGEVAVFTQYGTSVKASPSDQGIPVLTMGNIQGGLVVFNSAKSIAEDSAELPALLLKKFDLLYNRTNSAELVGKTGIYLGEDDCRTFASYLIRLRFSLTHTSPHFVNLAMNTQVFRETQIVPLIKKQTGQANVNGTALKNMLIPFPPLAEQHRIVAKVDELMAVCDQLETQLTATQTDSRRLLEAVLREALAPAAERELTA